MPDVHSDAMRSAAEFIAWIQAVEASWAKISSADRSAMVTAAAAAKAAAGSPGTVEAAKAANDTFVARVKAAAAAKAAVGSPGSPGTADAALIGNAAPDAPATNS